MNIEIYKNLLSDPDLLKDEQISELKNIIGDYPYFQSARALYLKGLKNQESFKYNNELKITAGVYEFRVDGEKVVARYSYVFKKINNRMRIVNHHSSELVKV